MTVEPVVVDPPEMTVLVQLASLMPVYPGHPGQPPSAHVHVVVLFSSVAVAVPSKMDPWVCTHCCG